jgi:hypothetical protein
MQMTLDKSMPVEMGKIHGNLYGGPFRKYVPGTRRLVGIKMAEEVEHPHDFKVDTEDFSVPKAHDMAQGIQFGLQELSKGNDLYVGCMGGIGRTGLYMACMAKVMFDYRAETGHQDLPRVDPVDYVRHHYIPHAVETSLQKAFVSDFDTSPWVEWLKRYHQLQVVTVDRVVERIVYLSPAEWVKRVIHGVFR